VLNHSGSAAQDVDDVSGEFFAGIFLQEVSSIADYRVVDPDRRR
jgi:hypothetical protein